VDIEGRRECKVFGVGINSKAMRDKIGDILTEKSELKEEDIEVLDHLIKEGIFKRIKEIE